MVKVEAQFSSGENRVLLLKKKPGRAAENKTECAAFKNRRRVYLVSFVPLAARKHTTF